MRPTILLFVLIACLGASVPAVAQQDDAGPYEQGKFSLSLGGSTRSDFGNRYFVVHAGGGYFVLDGLQAGLGGAWWIGPAPAVAQVTPGINYHFWMVPAVVPYVGTFYRHWFIGADIPDVDTLGARAGFSFASRHLILSLGAVYERIISACVEDCASVYPEIGVSISL